MEQRRGSGSQMAREMSVMRKAYRFLQKIESKRGVQDRTYGNKSHDARSSGSLGVPSPGTGSHPTLALNSVVSWPGLQPSVM